MADKKISALTAASTPLAGTEVLPIVQSGSTVKVSISDVTAGRVVGASSVAVSSLSSPYVRVDNGALGTLNVASLELWTTNNFSGRSKTFIRNECQNAGNSNADLVFGVNSTGGGAEYEAARLKGVGGDLQLAIGNLVIGTAGKGIDFSAATHAAGMTSELLDWYEEGAFTPVVEGSSSAGTASYAAQAAKYTRIGNTVYFQIYLVWSGGTGTGELRIAGLPFTSSAGAPFGGVSTPVFTGVALTAAHYCTGAYVLSSDTKMRFFQTPIGGGAGSAVTYSAAGECMLVGQYSV